MTKTATIREEYIVEKQGKKFVLAPGLVDAAHRAFTSLSIVSTLIQYGNDENGNTWIASTKVECDNGTYVQLGDASPRNTSSQMLGVLPRLAETRSVSRALRLAVNAGVLAIFDDPDEDDDARPTPSRPAPRSAEPPGFAEPARASAAGPRVDKQALADFMDRPAPAEPARPRGAVSLEAASEPARPIQRAEPTLAPGPRPPSAGAPSMPTPHATEPQVRAIFATAFRNRGMSEHDTDTDAMLKYGAVVSELSVADAAAYIKLLNAKEVAAR